MGARPGPERAHGQERIGGGDRTWRERLALWNERFPRWRFKDARRFQAAFRRGELQLTGNRGGLRLLYWTLQEYEQNQRDLREAWHARMRAEGQLPEQTVDAKQDA